MVPEGWEVKELDALCKKIAVGLAISVTPHMRNEGVKLIRNQNIKRNYFNDRSVIYIDPEFAEANRSKKVKPGDIVAVRTGSNIGEACVVPAEFDGALTFTTLIARPDPKLLDSFFLSTHINSDRGVAEVNRLCAGGGKPNLNSGELKRYRLLAPPLPEQKKIAQILTTWDKAIATTEQLLANSQQQKKALMQQLLTGKKRLFDKNGVRFNGEWKAIEIGNFLKESRIPSKTNDPSKRLTVRLNLKGVEPREFRGTEAVESTAHFVRAAGQFIYGKQNIHKGAFGIIPKSLDAYETSQDLPAFDFTGACDSIWFFHYMTQEHFFASLEDKMSGTGSKRLNPKTFFKIKIRCPSIEEQQKIAAVLSTAVQEISALQQKLDALKQEKKALMQQLLTGKRRVTIEKKELIK